MLFNVPQCPVYPEAQWITTFFLSSFFDIDCFVLIGQIKLLNTSVLIVGAGGLGCPSAQYLAAAGVGKKSVN